MKNSLSKGITNQQCSDTGMAMALIAVLAGLLTKHHAFYEIALIILVVDMIMPILFYPLAIVWFGFSKVMSLISSQLLLGFVFFLVVTPVGLIRKLTGKDRLNLRAFKKVNNTAFTDRLYLYKSSDLTNTF